MTYPIVFVVVGVILVIWGIFRLTNVKATFLIGWRNYQINKEKGKSQKK